MAPASFACRALAVALIAASSIVAPAAATRLPSLPKPESAPSSSLLSRILDFGPFRWSLSRTNRNQHTWWENDQILESLRIYEDQVVIRFNVTTRDDEAALRRAIDRMILDVWDFTANHTDVRIETKKRVRAFLNMLPESLRDGHTVLIPNLSRAIAASFPSKSPDDPELQSLLRNRGVTESTKSWVPFLSKAAAGVDDLFFQDYQSFTTITTWMKFLESMFKARGHVRLISLGKSYEGRDIPALRVGLRDGDEQERGRRDTILITGGIHAREWISTSSVNYLAWAFIRAIDSDPLVTTILENFDIVFAPVLNPDGYVYSWDVDRLWRKSRQPTTLSICPGFDLDHSFGFRWNSLQHQDEQCSESYGGHMPFEAVEAKRLADWAHNETQHGTNFVAFIDLHSYSQQVLFPYEYSCDALPPSWETLQEVAFNLAKHLRLANGEPYTVASACEGAVGQGDEPPKATATNKDAKNPELYRIENRGGAMVDYFFHEFGARHSYQIKLRDTGSYGFLLPSSAIVPTGDEVFQAMRYLGDYLLGNNGHEWSASSSSSSSSSSSWTSQTSIQKDGDDDYANDVDVDVGGDDESAFESSKSSGNLPLAVDAENTSAQDTQVELRRRDGMRRVLR
ncbi:extracellular matrix protein 14 [Microdochium nivale]|nr:extracellular matrix protein 14 [Microdochium nivale]